MEICWGLMESLMQEREIPGDMEEIGGVATAGEGEPRRHGGEVESLLQESYRERENQGDMEEIGGVVTGEEGEADP